jgi:hypothetical protein
MVPTPEPEKEKTKKFDLSSRSEDVGVIRLGDSKVTEKELRKLGSVLGSGEKITFIPEGGGGSFANSRSARDGANTGGGQSSSPGFSARPGEMRSAPGLGNRNLDRAEELQRQGLTKSAQRQREQFERLQDKQRQRDANRELQKDLGLRSDVRMSPEQIARQEGKVNPLNRKEFNKRVEEIEEEIKRRAGQGDGTQDTSSTPGGGGGKSGESSLEKLVGEIKSLVEKIEPKLPTHALA